MNRTPHFTSRPAKPLRNGDYPTIHYESGGIGRLSGKLRLLLSEISLQMSAG
jgi:hypothetical protein